jgi:hypothetical protein
MRERIHKERTAALGAHVASLDEEQREALWAALPVLEELAEQLPGPHGPRGSHGPDGRDGSDGQSALRGQRGSRERQGVQDQQGGRQ